MSRTIRRCVQSRAPFQPAPPPPGVSRPSFMFKDYLLIQNAQEHEMEGTGPTQGEEGKMAWLYLFIGFHINPLEQPPHPTPPPPFFWACVNVLEALNGRWNFQWIACKSINCKDHYLVSMRLNQLSHSIPHLHTKCFILAINESAPLYVWLITCLQEMDSFAISLNSVDAEQFETWRRQQ